MTQPPHDQPEYLDSHGGEPVPPAGRDPQPNRRKGRRLGLGVAGLAGAAVIGGGVWAASSFLGDGPQPAEALPSSTLAYVSVNLDPSAGQKLEAIKTLNKFPAFANEFDVASEDDLRRLIFDRSGLAEECTKVDYDTDIEPWLGMRAAFAAVSQGDQDPTPVVVLESRDATAAESGLTKLKECSGPEESFGWEISGDWVVLAETDDLAHNVVSKTDDGTLADEENYQQWTGEAGDPGIVSMYAAPEAGDLMLAALEGGGWSANGPSGQDVPKETRNQLADFAGMAGTIRFHDGGVEAEFASAAGESGLRSKVGTAAGEAVASLPDDTVAAFGLSLQPGWFEPLVDQFAQSMGTGTSTDDVIADLEKESGLSLPEDAETLLGESAVLALGPGLDVDALERGETDVPLGLRVSGDPDEIEAVLNKLRDSGGQEAQPWLQSDANDDTMAIGPQEAYRKALLEGGDLGDTEAYQDVVVHSANAGSVLFIDFDGDDWLVDAVDDSGADPELKDNLEPLSALGVSAWVDGDVSHGMLRITTN